jgi:hypothetical protein
VTVDKAGDYAAHIERGVARGVEGELDDSPEKEFWRVEQVKFESLGTRFYRQYILSKREDGLHIETMLKLIVDGTIRIVPPYLVLEAEEWTINWPTLRREHVWELFRFYEIFDDECWEYPEIIWNPRGISKKWDDAVNVQYDQIKTFVGTKLLRRSLRPTQIRSDSFRREPEIDWSEDSEEKNLGEDDFREKVFERVEKAEERRMGRREKEKEKERYKKGQPREAVKRRIRERMEEEEEDEEEEERQEKVTRKRKKELFDDDNMDVERESVTEQREKSPVLYPFFPAGSLVTYSSSSSSSSSVSSSSSSSSSS